jgi:hypothetical protein
MTGLDWTCTKGADGSGCGGIMYHCIDTFACLSLGKD